MTSTLGVKQSLWANSLIELFLAAFTVMMPLAYYVNYCFQFAGLPGVASWAATMLMALLSIFVYAITFVKKPVVFLFGSAGVVATVFISSAICGNDAFMFGSGGYSGIVGLIMCNTGVLITQVLPIACLAFFKPNIERFASIAKPFAIAALVCQIAAFVLSITTGSHPIAQDYMSFAYFSFVPLLILLLSEMKSRLTFVLMLLSLAITLIAGCRGALIAILIFLIAYSLLCLPRANRKKILLIVVGATLAMLAIAEFDYLVGALNQFLSEFGVSSRTLNALSGQSSFFDQSGRDEIFSTAFEHVAYFGYGLFGDREVVGTLGTITASGAMLSSGAYVHNWILELLLDFGVLIGIPVAAFVCILTLNYYIRSFGASGRNLKVIACFGIAMIFGKYLVSASLFTTPDFFFAVCLLVSTRHLLHKRKTSNGLVLKGQNND